MRIINKKNNIFLDNISQKDGIALLFSIMLSTIFLTIAIGVLNIAVKELNFSSSAKDTNNAFFAADSGVECALYNDRSDKTIFTKGSGEIEITCFDKTNLKLTGGFPSYSFNIPGLGSNGNSCAKVTILKTVDEVDPSIVFSTVITSKGYNIGDEECNSTAKNRVERVLEVSY